MSSLKDALMKAGFKSSKSENERPKASQGQRPSKVHGHQQARTYCDVCERTLPDVEHYRHRNPTVDAQWICIGCADKNEIPDSTRTTAQSEMAKKGMFRRFYGATNTALKPPASKPTGPNKR